MFDQLYEFHKIFTDRPKNEQLAEKATKNIIPIKNMSNDAAQLSIKNIRLDEQNYLLEINKGEKIISFKSKKKGEGLEKETKLFKILFHLWDYRQELKGNKIIKKGSFVSLDNLKIGSGSKNPKAVYKQIQRLNGRFKKEGVAIEIKGQNEKYHLIINKL